MIVLISLFNKCHTNPCFLGVPSKDHHQLSTAVNHVLGDDKQTKIKVIFLSIDLKKLRAI